MLIPHPRPLLEGRLIARYDRFVASIDLNGTVVDAHCVNPGRMEGLVRAGIRAWVSRAPEGTKRKLKYTLELLEIDGHCVGANTIIPNLLAETLIRARQIPGLRRFRDLRREVPYGEKSRIDIQLMQGTTEHLIEVKNCHLVYPDGGAYFPDSVSTRASAHLHELARQVVVGRKATVLFVLQRDDGKFLRPSILHDPAFAAAAYQAHASGVRFLAVKLAPRPEGFTFHGMIPVDLTPYDPAPLEAYRRHLLQDSGWKRRGPVKPVGQPGA